MPSRRGHKNSHHGCMQCKQRRLKCDETQPVCLRCQRRNLTCTYTHLLSAYCPFDRPKAHPDSLKSLGSDALLSPQAPSPASVEVMYKNATFPLGNGTDRLFHYFFAEVLHSMPQASTFELFGQFETSIRRQVANHSFLYDGVVAFAALHAARVDPTARRTYVAKALDYQNRALERFRVDLDTLSTKNCEAALGCAALTVMYRLAFPNIADGVVYDPVSELKIIISLVRGLVALFRVGYHTFLDTNLTPHIRDVALKAHASSGCVPEVEAALNLLYGPLMVHPAVVSTSQDVQEALKFAVSRLHIVFHCVVAFPGAHSYVLMWASMVTPAYLEALNSQNPAALVILAHWAAALHDIQHYWWLSGWGTATVKAIAASLGPTWQPFLQWPIHETGVILDGWPAVPERKSGSLARARDSLNTIAVVVGAR